MVAKTFFRFVSKPVSVSKAGIALQYSLSPLLLYGDCDLFRNTYLKCA